MNRSDRPSITNRYNQIKSPPRRLPPMAKPAPQPPPATPGAKDRKVTTPAPKARICYRYEIRHSLGRTQPPLSPSQLGHQHSSPVQTFLAWDHQNNRNVVLKALPFDQMQDWKPLERFEREALALSKLDHPGIPRYLDYIEHRETDATATTFYLVQTYVEGLSLGERVRRGDRFNEASVKAIARQGLAILDYLHSLNPPLIHRDIKPDNLLCNHPPDPTTEVTQAPQLYLVDFGAAQAITSSDSTIMGTYGYMAPEQFRGQASTASDLYSLGATLLNLLTHQNPVALPTQRLRIDFRSILNLSEDFALWLDGLLAPMAADRFPSARQALAALDNPASIATHQGTTTPVAAPDSSISNLTQPSNSKIRLQRQDGSYPLTPPSLTLDIPPIGLQRELWALGSFALIWNGGLLYWLIMAWAMDAPWFYALVSAPLWGLGLLLMARLGQSFFGQVRLVVKQDQYYLEQRLGPLRRERRGPLSDWQSIDLRQQYSRDSEAVTALAMVIGLETVEFGVMLSEAEKQWLVSALQDFLNARP